MQWLNSITFIGWISSFWLDHSRIFKFFLFLSLLSSKQSSFCLFTNVESLKLINDVQSIHLSAQKNMMLLCATQAVSFWNPSIMSYFHLPFFLASRREIFSWFYLLSTGMLPHSCSTLLITWFFLLHPLDNIHF